MVGRKDAVAIGEQEIWRVACPHAVVAAERDAEAVVPVADPMQRGRGRPRELAYQALCVIRRAIVGDNDFELSVHAALMSQRYERTLKVRRTLVRREDHRYFELGWHGISRLANSRCGI